MKKEIILKNVEEEANELALNAEKIIDTRVIKVNNELITLYWELGKLVSDYKNNNRSRHGDEVVKIFTEKLQKSRGVGYNRRNIYNAIRFYESSLFVPPGGQMESNVGPGRQIKNVHPGAQMNFKNISWSHIRELLTIKDKELFIYYLNEVETKNLSKRQLIDSIKSKAFERTIGNQKTKGPNNKFEGEAKDPIILNVKKKRRTERQLETEVFLNIFEFMKEIGSDVILKGKQYKINCNGLIHKIDLVLYESKYRFNILIDFKIGKVKQRDISQMQFYIENFNEYELNDGDGPTIGIVLAETKDIRVADVENIYQIQYLNQIPKEKELLKIINDNKVILLKTERLLLGKQSVSKC